MEIDGILVSQVFRGEKTPNAVIFTEDSCRHKSLVRGYRHHYPNARLLCWRQNFVANLDDLPLKEIERRLVSSSLLVVFPRFSIQIALRVIKTTTNT